MLKGLSRVLSYNVNMRSLSQIFDEAVPNVQERPLNIFYRSKSLIDFHQALDHIYEHATNDPNIVY